jgi:hypothetical protein
VPYWFGCYESAGNFPPAGELGRQAVSTPRNGISSSALPAAILFATLGLALRSQCQAQGVPPAPRVPQQEALRVLLDCAGIPCDYDFLRTEINFVSQVRERQDAQVYVLITGQETAARGTGFTVYFIGQKEFHAAADTLHYTSEPAESQDQVRQRLAQLLKRGLVRYANHTPLAEGIRISYDTSDAPPPGQTAARQDRWNNWTFSTTLNGSVNSEKSFTTLGLNASLLGNRTTEAWKINTLLRAGYSEARIQVSEDQTIVSVSRDFALNGLVVKSLGGHWSAGARTTLTSSTFLNQSLALRLAPAVEYNFFPYAESTRRQFTVQYSVGTTSFDYAEKTIYGKTSETLLDQKLIATLSVTQPWGSISASLEGSNYLSDFSKRRGTMVSNIDLKLFGGFSLVLLGGAELVRDQIFLPSRGASAAEILLQEQQLATSFRYWSSVGISYTFGSPFAGVVNPRFEGTSGGQAIVR